VEQSSARMISRRRVIAGMGGVAAAALLPMAIAPRVYAATVASDPIEVPTVDQQRVIRVRPDARHLAWVWQFQADGDPAKIRDTLAANGLGVAMKTHDATHWMGRYYSTGASGPGGVAALAKFFEQGGVPFHAWAVVHGKDPLKEAEMAADVLGAGARSIFLDLESHPGFWQGTPATAMKFGTELRRRRPNSWISTSVDPRPWELPLIPLKEFASFSDEISPQTYWDLFKSPANIKGYQRSGEQVPARGVTPSFVVESAMRHLRSFGLPLHPIGDGTAGSLAAWGEFINQSYGEEAETVSVWRFGVADPGVWRLLKNTPPRSLSYLVGDGESLADIAKRLKTTVPALVDANSALVFGTAVAGMRLRLPSDTSSGTPSTVQSASVAPRATPLTFPKVPTLSSKVQAYTKQ
jgi:hypothetical protein